MSASAALAAVAILAAGPQANLVDETGYGEVLTAYVRAGKVDYAGLKKDRARLDAYVRDVGGVSKASFDAASKEARIAYLVNAYNAFTLVTILDNHPIKSAGGLFNTAPANSIKQIKGAWDGRKHKTALGDLTLDDIEHKNLRKSYDTPLVHMALVCASKGCPPLRAEPYRADRLLEQLEDQARTYLAGPYGLVVDGNRIQISMIFKWFNGDFKAAYGSGPGFAARYAPADKRPAVEAAVKSGAVSYIDYDWSLNELLGKS